MNKRTKFKILLDTLNPIPHIVAITEVKPKNISRKLSISEFNIEGYNVYGCNLENDIGRGILLYVNKGMSASVIDLPIDFKEMLFCLVKTEIGDNLIVGTIYRSPNSELCNDEKLFKVINYVSDKYKLPLLILGDFNLIIEWDNWKADKNNLTSGTTFLDTLRKIFLSQHVDRPTRQRGIRNLTFWILF